MILVAVKPAQIFHISFLVYIDLIYRTYSYTFFRIPFFFIGGITTDSNETVLAKLLLYKSLQFIRILEFYYNTASGNNIFVSVKLYYDTSAFGPYTSVSGTGIPRKSEEMLA